MAGGTCVCFLPQEKRRGPGTCWDGAPPAPSLSRAEGRQLRAPYLELLLARRRAEVAGSREVFARFKGIEISGWWVSPRPEFFRPLESSLL